MPTLFFQQNTSMRHTPVADYFLLHQMPEANGDYVKVYLSIYHAYYRDLSDYSTAKAAESLRLLESDVMKALSYWDQKGALSLHQTKDQLWVTFPGDIHKSPIKADFSSGKGQAEGRSACADPSSPEKDSAGKEPMAKVIKVEKAPSYSPEELEVYRRNPLIKDLFSYAQSLLGEPLSSANLSILFSFYDVYRLEIPVIKYLMEYCISNGNRSFRYMEKVAQDWASHQIDSLETARLYTQRFDIYRPLYKALGTSFHAPSEKESECVERWLYQYELPMELILEAARRTFAQIGKPNFNYMEGILKPWYQQGVKTLEDVAALDEAYQSRRAEAQSPQPRQEKRSGIIFAAGMKNYENPWDDDEYEA